MLRRSHQHGTHRDGRAVHDQRVVFVIRAAKRVRGPHAQAVGARLARRRAREHATAAQIDARGQGALHHAPGIGRGAARGGECRAGVSEVLSRRRQAVRQNRERRAHEAQVQGQVAVVVIGIIAGAIVATLHTAVHRLAIVRERNDNGADPGADRRGAVDAVFIHAIITRRIFTMTRRAGQTCQLATQPKLKARHADEVFPGRQGREGIQALRVGRGAHQGSAICGPRLRRSIAIRIAIQLHRHATGHGICAIEAAVAVVVTEHQITKRHTGLQRTDERTLHLAGGSGVPIRHLQEVVLVDVRRRRRDRAAHRERSAARADRARRAHGRVSAGQCIVHAIPLPGHWRRHPGRHIADRRAQGEVHADGRALVQRRGRHQRRMAQHIDIPLIQRVQTGEVLVQVHQVVRVQILHRRQRIGRGQGRSLQTVQHITGVRVARRQAAAIAWTIAQRVSHQPQELVVAKDFAGRGVVVEVAEVTTAGRAFRRGRDRGVIVARPVPCAARQR